MSISSTPDKVLHSYFIVYERNIGKDWRSAICIGVNIVKLVDFPNNLRGKAILKSNHMIDSGECLGT